MKPRLVLSLFNVTSKVSLGAELSGDFGKLTDVDLTYVDLEIRGDSVWDVDRQQFPGKVVAVVTELDGGDHDYSHDLTAKINRAIAKTTGVNVVRVI